MTIDLRHVKVEGSLLSSESEQTVSNEFSLDDLFFSRTDTRGVIQSGNTVFQRVSEFDWDGLLKAPHKIVRHPEMPKGVFQLIWDTLKSGEPTGGYIQNKRKVGDPYWVFAYITPVTDGYLSVRLKPSSDEFQKIAPLYAELLEYENDDDVTPELSKKRLIEMLKDLGFDDYKQFFYQSLVRELNSRNTLLGRPPNGPVQQLAKILETWGKVTELCMRIDTRYTEISETAQNLQIQAVRLGERGKSLAVIAEQFQQTATALQKSLSEFLNESQAVTSYVEESAFGAGASRILDELRLDFDVHSVLKDEAGTAHERDVLDTVAAIYSDNARKALENLRNQVLQFNSVSLSVTQHITSLTVTRVMCEIETAPLGKEYSGITGAIQALESFTESSGLSITEIRQALAKVEGDIKTCLDSMSSKPSVKKVAA